VIDMAQCVYFKADSGGLLAYGDGDPLLASDSYVGCNAVVLEGADWQSIVAFRNSSGHGVFGGGEFDPSQGAAVFSLFFGVTVAVYLLAKSCGVVLQAIRRF
jgi:hypothetical protein